MIRMRSPSFLAMLISALLVLGSAFTGREILERATRRQAFKDAFMYVQIKKTRKSGRTRNIEMVVFQKNYPEMTNTLARVEFPEEAKGISFLTWDYKDPEKPDQNWYYIPAINQYHQLTEEKGKSYEEKFGFSMEIFNIDLDLAEHRLVGEEEIEGAPCYKVESIMKDQQSPEGARILTWVRKDNWLAVKVQAFDQAGDLIRDFCLTRMDKIGGIWLEAAGTYKDMRKDQTIEFNITESRLNTGLKDELFLTSTLPDKAKAP